MSTLKCTNLQHASAASPAIVLASDGTATAQLSSLNGGALSGARNRIINGDMRIDQRNAGASVTPTDAYTLDRWEIREDTDGAVSVQQVSEAPTGFQKSLKVTITTADSSLSATQRCLLDQRIEGFNTADLDWGTANAKTVTLSFWVRSSLTGTFGGSLINNANNRAYPYTYSISAANTWEYKTVTIAGDTSGTWETTTSAGIKVYFGLGAGSTYSGTAGTWAASELYTATSAVSVIGTLNATWQITGVQLEAGSVATPFERRSYGQELALCQRYCYGQNNSAGQAYYLFGLGHFTSSAGTAANGISIFPVTMRTKPSVTMSAANTFFVDPGVTNFTTVLADQASVNAGVIQVSGGSGGGTAPAGGRWLSDDTDAAYVIWSAEL